MGVNSLPKTVTRQRRDCDLNPGLSAHESSTLTTRLPRHPNGGLVSLNLMANSHLPTPATRPDATRRNCLVVSDWKVCVRPISQLLCLPIEAQWVFLLCFDAVGWAAGRASGL